MPADKDPSHITDHPFKPKGAWWSLCEVCNLGEPAHAETTLLPKDREEGRG